MFTLFCGLRVKFVYVNSCRSINTDFRPTCNSLPNDNLKWSEVKEFAGDRKKYCLSQEIFN